MNTGNIAIYIIVGIIGFFIIYKLIIKPYLEKYDNTICYTGDIGCGKTLNATKKARQLWKRNKRSIKKQNWWNKQINKIINHHNKKALAYNEKHKLDPKPKQRKIWNLRKIYPLPRLFSNIPIIESKKKGIITYCNKFTKEMFMLIVKEKDKNCPPIPEYSVILIDETPQLINQFNWDNLEVQTNVNEFITFFRHYIGGYLVITAQARSEIVKQIRSKFSRYYWLSDMRKFFGIFYKVRIMPLTDIDENTTNFISDIDSQSKWKYGLLKPKIYDSRCFSERYPRDIEGTYTRFSQLKTNEIISFNKGKSPLGEKRKQTH